MSGVLILAGPTASGKTDLAIALARRFNAEIVGADSRQIYKNMPIGTAAPTAAQQGAVQHHLIEFLDPYSRYSAARFCLDAIRIIREIQSRGKQVIVAGGTGFYIRALTGSVELAPQYDADVRDRLAREARLHDATFLYEWLTVRDPGRAATLSSGDTYRVMRSLEIALAPQSRLRVQPLPTLVRAGIPFLKVFLNIERAQVEARIEQRTDAMLAAGLVEEAERIGEGAAAASAVGYPQVLAFVRGWCTFTEMRTLLIRATRRYAARQYTWFRSEPETHWLSPDEIEQTAREKLGWV